MLPIYILSRYNKRFLNGVLSQWLNINARWCSSSDSSSDSDSDSDSDTEKMKHKETHVKSMKPMTSDKNHLGDFLNNMIQESISLKTDYTNQASTQKIIEKSTKATTGSTDLNEYLNNMIKARKLQKIVNVAVQHKKKSSESLNKANKHMPYEKRLMRAAEDVATTLGGDKAKTTSDLLQKILPHKAISWKKGKRLANMNDSKPDEFPAQFTKSEKNIKFRQSPADEQLDDSMNNNSKKKSVIQTLLQEYNQRTADLPQNSISQQLLNDTKATTEQLENNNIKRPRIRQDLDIWNGQPSSIFKNMGVPSPNIPELKTWTALKQRELKALTTYPPANIFQELILWTEQGKLWKFPIDNEQDMEEEHNVHFSEHVFMERHLTGWCPKSGPIRHFMELVCNGLSKNPYMTVQEKINHIMWYKEYFESKEDLMQELGAIQEPFPKPKQITE